MTSSADIKIPLHSLLVRLRAEGFEIGTSAILDIQHIVANFQNEQVAETGDLKYLLAPIICRNKEEQAKFYKIFDEYLQSLNEKTLQVIEQPAVKKGWKKYWWRLFFPLMAVLIGYIIYLAIAEKHQTVSYGIVEKNNRKIDVAGDTIVLEVTYADSLESSAYTTNWQVKGPGNYIKEQKNSRQFVSVFDSAGTYNAYANTYSKEGKLLVADTASVEVLCEIPPSVDITGGATDSSDGKFRAVLYNTPNDTAYKFHWFVNDVSVPGDSVMQTDLLKSGQQNTVSVKVDWPAKNLHCSTDSLYQQLELQPPFQLTVSADANAPLSLNKNYNWTNILLSLSGLLVLPLLTAGLLWWKFRKPKHKPLTDEDNKPGEEDFKGPFFIEFNNHQDRIMPEAGISQLAEVLRKRHTSDILQLSINKTIKSTIRSGGFPVLEYVPRTQATDFLILLDKEFPEGHLTMLFAYVIERLKKEQVHLTIYTFSREPLMLSNEGLNHILLPIDKVARLYPDTMLIIFSQAEGFFKSYDVILKDWVTEKFKSWNTKLLLTPLAKKDWGAKELVLYNAGFTVVPADMNAYTLISDEINLMIDKQKLKKEIVPETYGSRQFNFNRWRQVKAYLATALLENDRQFNHKADVQLVEQWLCALAVYPHINWQVTIAVGKAFEETFSTSGHLVNYSNLLVLSRIQWMNDGQLMDSLRIEMLNHLEPEKEALARKVIVELMKEIEPAIEDDSMIKNEFDFLNTANKVLLNAHDSQKQELTSEEWQQFKAYVDNDQVDWTLQTYLQKGENTLLTDPQNPNRTLPLNTYMQIKEKQDNEASKKEKIKPVWSVNDLLKKLAPAFSFILIALIAWLLLKANDRLQFVNQYQFANLIFQADSASTSKAAHINSLSVLLGGELLQGVATGNNSFAVVKVPVSDSSNQAIVQVSLSTGNLEYPVTLESSKYIVHVAPSIPVADTSNVPGIVDLPNEINEIWKITDSTSGFQIKMAFYLNSKLVFVKEIPAAPTQQMKLEEGGQFKQGIYKVIFQIQGKYNVGFFRNISSTSLEFVYCLRDKGSFDSLREARKVQMPGCNEVNVLNVLYQPVAGSKNDGNSFTIQFPQNSTDLYISEEKIFQGALAKWNAIPAAEKSRVTATISLNGFYKFDKDIQQRQKDIRGSKLGLAFSKANWQYKPFSGNAFQRDYVTINFSGSASTGPNCNIVYTSIKEALSVKPGDICKLDLSNQYLYNLPKEVYSFTNLQQLNISGNYISDAEIKTFSSRFPKCQVINNANPNQQNQNPIQQQQIPVKSNLLDAVLKAALGEVSSSKN